MNRLLGIMLCAFMITSSANASTPDAGAIGEIKGSGVLERDNMVIEGNTGVGVQSMDTAVTANGRMRIDFLDETRVDLTEHSRLLIDEFVYDPANDVGSLSIKASLGGVRYASGQIAKRYQQNVKIKTPSATIGVRGTDFILVVDEVGGTMVTLLPSCDIDGYCFTGEIEVETDAGFVIMNQAFQTTMVTHSMRRPSPPLVLPLDEKMINQLLILRKKKPYQEEEDEIRRKTKRQFDFLGIDALEFDELDGDELTDSIKDIWLTDLDHNVDYYLGEMLHDMIDMLNLALSELFRNELEKQNEQFFAEQQYGYDEKTRITFNYVQPNYHIIRNDIGMYHHLDMKLNDQYGYTLNIGQQDEVVYDYRVGAGSNTIDITQRQ
jgi:hypothetical protein